MPEHSEPAEGGNADQIAYWNARAAVTWTEYQERIDAVFEPVTRLLLSAAAPASGERVIDVGCGCGATVLELARSVGAQGNVLGLDISEPMATRARDRIAAAGLANAEVQVADAAALRFTSAPADLLVSRFGVMFFAAPAAAFANLRRAMRPGGRMVFAAWRALADNPWFAAPLQAARPYLPPEAPPDPHAPGPFAFADRDRVQAILTEAGWHDVAIARHDLGLRAAASGQVTEATDFMTHVGPLARILAEADVALRTRVQEAVADVLRSHDTPEGIVLQGSIWLVTAQA